MSTRTQLRFALDLRLATRARSTKDLVDLVLISALSHLDAAILRRQIDTIFALRDTHAARDPARRRWVANPR